MAEDEVRRIASTDNYYKVLKVASSCNASELKKAYRRLALLLHPDKCDIEGAHEAFAKVSNAYSCLSDEESRAHYDRWGVDQPASGGGGGHGNPFHPPGFQHADPEEMFREFMRQNPDLAAGFEAGAGGNPASGFQGMDDIFQKFNFSAAALAAMWHRWEEWRMTLPILLRAPVWLLGFLIYGLLTVFLRGMPLTGIIAGGISAWWLIRRVSWLLAFAALPARVKPKLWMQVVLLLILEFGGVELAFGRGVYYCLIAIALQFFVGKIGGRSNATSPGGSSSFSFQFGNDGFNFASFTPPGGNMPSPGMGSTRGHIS